jgi:hypothetical protein
VHKQAIRDVIIIQLKEPWEVFWCAQVFMHVMQLKKLGTFDVC